MRFGLALPHLIIKLTAIIFLILAVVATLIRLQPFDDGGLHDLLFADGCPLPCFMGIQPGITTALQAYDLLQQQAFVSQWIEPPHPMEQIGDDSGFGLLRWRWSDKRPAPLTGIDAGLVYNRKTGFVITFGSMGTRLSLGQSLIVLGQPTMGYMSVGYNDRDGSTFTHVVGYPQWHFNLVSTIQCPMTLRQLWDAPVTLQLAPTADQNARFTGYPAHLQPLLGYAAGAFC